jgi:hypothetical protein
MSADVDLLDSHVSYVMDGEGAVIGAGGNEGLGVSHVQRSEQGGGGGAEHTHVGIGAVVNGDDGPGAASGVQGGQGLSVCV